jgi:hypothetical protein
LRLNNLIFPLPEQKLKMAILEGPQSFAPPLLPYAQCHVSILEKIIKKSSKLRLKYCAVFEHPATTIFYTGCPFTHGIHYKKSVKTKCTCQFLYGLEEKKKIFNVKFLSAFNLKLSILGV